MNKHIGKYFSIISILNTLSLEAPVDPLWNPWNTFSKNYFVLTLRSWELLILFCYTPGMQSHDYI